MTNSRAIDLLFYTWVTFALILLLLVIVQSLGGKYGNDWAIPLQWVVWVAAPCLALVTAAWRNKGKGKWNTNPVAMPQFVLAVVMSAVVVLGTIAIFIFEAVGQLKLFDIIPVTVGAFALVQAIIIASVSNIAFAGR